MTIRIGVIVVLAATLVLTYFYFPDKSPPSEPVPKSGAQKAAESAPKARGKRDSSASEPASLRRGIVWHEEDLSGESAWKSAVKDLPQANRAPSQVNQAPPAPEKKVAENEPSPKVPPLPVPEAGPPPLPVREAGPPPLPAPEPGPTGKGWQTGAAWVEEQLRDCRQTEGPSDKCLSLPARTADHVFGFSDFVVPSGYLSVQGMAEYILSHGRDWKEIGDVLGGEALSKGLRAAREGKVVAAFRSPAAQDGVMAFLLPSDTSRSSTWEVDVPEAVVFFARNPGASFVGKRLSFAWKAEEAENVRIYVRQSAGR